MTFIEQHDPVKSMLQQISAAPAAIPLSIAFLGILGLRLLRARRLQWRDPNRLFSWHQKKELLARAGNRCEHKLPIWFRCPETEGLQADHIVLWSGATVLWNGQVLRLRRNRRKGAHPPMMLDRCWLERRRRSPHYRARRL